MIIPITLPYVTQSSNSAVNYKALVLMVDCPTNPQSPFISNLGDTWNCNLCGGDSSYSIPFERNDILYFQTSLPDRKNPATNILIAGWGQSTAPDLTFTYIRAEMYDCSGTTLLFGDIDEFAADYWVGFNSQIGSIQNFVINTATLPIGLNSFRIKLITYNADNSIDRIQWSEPYEIPVCPEGSILIESDYKNLDCASHFYGTPNPFLAASSPPPVGYMPTTYKASFRLLGEIALVGSSTESVLNENNRVLSQTVRDTYEIQAYQPIPPYAVELLKLALYGDNLTINGESYVNAGELQKNNDGSRMFFINTTVEKICKNSNKICN